MDGFRFLRYVVDLVLPLFVSRYQAYLKKVDLLGFVTLFGEKHSCSKKWQISACGQTLCSQDSAQILGETFPSILLTHVPTSSHRKLQGFEITIIHA